MKAFVKMMKKSLPKRTEEMAYIFFIILIICLAFLLTAGISLKAGKPIGADFWLHLRFSESYAQGEIALFDEEFWSVLNGPYPPLFHFMLVPFVWLGIAVEFASLLQVFFYPLALFTTVFLVWKKVDIPTAAFTAVFLFSSVAFFDRSMQVIPQALDMILFPLAVYFFLEKRHVHFLVSMSAIVYSHGAYGFHLFGALILYHLKSRTGPKMIRNGLIVAAPLIILTLVFLPAQIEYALGTNSPQEAFMFQNPFYLFGYASWVLTIFFVFSLFSRFFGRRETDSVDTLLFFWIIALIPILIFFPERFVTYVVVPMSIMASKALAKNTANNRLIGLGLLLVIFLIALQSYLSWWHVLWGTGNIRFDIH